MKLMALEVVEASHESAYVLECVAFTSHGFVVFKLKLLLFWISLALSCDCGNRTRHSRLQIQY